MFTATYQQLNARGLQPRTVYVQLHSGTGIIASSERVSVSAPAGFGQPALIEMREALAETGCAEALVTPLPHTTT